MCFFCSVIHAVFGQTHQVLAMEEATLAVFVLCPLPDLRHHVPNICRDLTKNERTHSGHKKQRLVM